jgi:hypothetical protein
MWQPKLCLELLCTKSYGYRHYKPHFQGVSMRIIGSLFHLSAAQHVRHQGTRGKRRVQKLLNNGRNIFLVEWRGMNPYPKGIELDGHAVTMSDGVLMRSARDVGRYQRLTLHKGLQHAILVSADASEVKNPDGTAAQNITQQRRTLSDATHKSLRRSFYNVIMGNG